MGVILRKAVQAVAVLIIGLSPYGAVAAPDAAAAAVVTPAPAIVTVVVPAGVGAAAAENTPSVAVDLPSLAAYHSRDRQRVGAMVVASDRKSGKVPATPKSGCEPVKAFLSTYYRVAWRLAMHTPNVAAAFEVFTVARRYASSYIDAHPRAKPAVVCVTPRLVRLVLPKVVAIMKRHQRAGGPLPRAGKYRSMNRAEVAAMRKAVAVPLGKPLPKKVLPKTVPMFV